MEMKELRYFLAVSKTENIHQASVDINVSTSALSKAIARLEEEFSVKLFKRIGRNIFLSDQGRICLLYTSPSPRDRG